MVQIGGKVILIWPPDDLAQVQLCWGRSELAVEFARFGRVLGEARASQLRIPRQMVQAGHRAYRKGLQIIWVGRRWSLRAYSVNLTMLKYPSMWLRFDRRC